jgi:RimJ/RimL family protein N-acetyltransferase
MSPLLLRDLQDTDLPIFFTHQLDPAARHMAAFTAKDPNDHPAFLAHWTRIRTDPTVTIKTILIDNAVAGHILSYQDEGHPEVTYWLGREYWGRGIATRALTEFLAHTQRTRPIFARAAKDNTASLRVLQKCGFTRLSESKGFANARRQEIEEWLLVLQQPQA